ncbi:restriction endonuclease subunit S [Enterococcus faecium]|nr:restriction endonuclease subunit S [Enterococcus faecium]
MSNDAQPEIRFPGFTDDWEQRKLGEVADIIGGGTPNTNNPEYWNGDIDWYAPAEIGKQIYVKNSQKKISQLGLQKSSAKILPIGTVLFTSRAGIGNTAILAKEGTTNQGFQSIVPHENKLDSYFIFSRTHELKRYGEVTGAGSTFAEVSGKQMAKMPILIPYIDEQQKIGIFFKKLDDTITLHQRKLDLLKETKKGFLQKMFPKNGAKVPEIRFPGFTEDWEQRKLGELATIVRGASPRPIQDPKWFDTESDVGWLRIADVTEQDGRIYYLEQHISKLGQEKTRVLVEPHLLLSIAATVGKPVVNYVKTGVHDGFLIFLNAIFDREFMFQWLEMFRPKWQKYGQPGSQVNLNSELVRNQEILIPNNEEQQKIGSFFKQLDDMIALHQRELDVLKETKKGFLQKMFV